MGTWAGAIVETKGREDFAAIASVHGVTIEDSAAEWVLVQVDAGPENLGPPEFAQALSRDLQGTVIAFFVQSPGSAEQIARYENGELVPKPEGTTDDVRGLCAKYGLDPDRPGARHTPKVSGGSKVVTALIILVLVGLLLIAVLSRR